MIINELVKIIEDRKKKLPSNSYVTSLMKAGENKILNKIKEETDEVIYASKKENMQRVVSEVADLLFHLLVLLSIKEINIKDVFKELQKRRSASSFRQ